MKRDELKSCAFRYYKLLVLKVLLLDEENFLNIFDNYIDKHDLDEKQIQEIRSFANKNKDELTRLLKKGVNNFISGAYSKLLKDPDLIKYSYQYQRNNFVDAIAEYLKRYGMKIPLHPEKDAGLFGESDTKTTFVETLLALEQEKLISILSLQIGLSQPHKVVSSQTDPVSLLPRNDLHKSSFAVHRVPVATIQLTKRLISLIEPRLSYFNHKISFKGKDIFIPEGNQDALCRILLRNKKAMEKEWSWDEVLEKWGGNYEKKENWRKVYNAGSEVNKKVAIETGIKDLFIVRKKTIFVNPKYLPLPK